MAPRRILAIGLDGFDITFAESLMAEGLLPAMAALRGRATSVELVHGAAKSTGLGWEHVASGLSPKDGGRKSLISFDPKTYVAAQEVTKFTPVFAKLNARMVVVDPPYFDLAKAPEIRGLTNWGAHDPGVDTMSRPGDILAEAKQLFGPYCAKNHIYGFCWPSSEKTKALAEGLARAVRQRADLSLWLLRDRLPDWDLGLVVVAETHSGVEPLWHGNDPAHPLAQAPSAPLAREGLRQIYQETDRLVGRLAAAFPDARLLVFSLHGMGTNDSDVAAMALLPELLYRIAFGKPYAKPAMPQHVLANGVPMLEENDNWGAVMRRAAPRPAAIAQRNGFMALWDRFQHADRAPGQAIAPPGNLEWMPSARYQPFWACMKAFALPSYYNGNIRVNLRGRESLGKVSPAAFEGFRDRLSRLLRECRNPLTGEPVVSSVSWLPGDPLARPAHDPDAIVKWYGVPLGFYHPKIGTIGPYPMMRTGGHTSHRGFAWFDGFAKPGHLGFRSAFDIVPTLFALLGEQVPQGVSGSVIEPLLGAANRSAA